MHVREARIFNTYGPRMHMNDGRVVSNFILQALKIDGLVLLMNSNYTQPVNLGNPVEHNIDQFAEIIKNLLGGSNKIAHLAEVQDDPQRRKPGISRAKKYLNWEPEVILNIGLQRNKLRKIAPINGAYSDYGAVESSGSIMPLVSSEKEVVHNTYDYRDLVASVQCLQLQLKKAGTGGGLSGRRQNSCGTIPTFITAIWKTRNKVQSTYADCLDALANVKTANAVELGTLLRAYELEALVPHDEAISALLLDTSTPWNFEGTALRTTISDHRYGYDNIKIVKIGKSTEPLGTN
ncbi:hypothetical protein WA026_016586 [Henosepilachna vigintioctopunctata]|uniref:Uncharacterized protein n=1 Tax=Henosepilachna vigintioctopunctata TaxID=420089 RepID=A0AAW1VAT8_9CUCU